MFILIIKGAIITTIKTILGLLQAQIRQIWKKVIKRGWEGIINFFSPFFLMSKMLLVKIIYKKNLPVLTKQFIITIKSSKIGHYAPLNKLTYKLNILINSIHYYLHQLGYKKLKINIKPGLI